MKTLKIPWIFLLLNGCGWTYMILTYVTLLANSFRLTANPPANPCCSMAYALAKRFGATRVTCLALVQERHKRFVAEKSPCQKLSKVCLTCLAWIECATGCIHAWGTWIEFPHAGHCAGGGCEGQFRLRLQGVVIFECGQMWILSDSITVCHTYILFNDAWGYMNSSYARERNILCMKQHDAASASHHLILW